MKKIVTLFLASLFYFTSYANNITVSNISLENLNAPNWVQVEFDLSWENSWRLSAGPSNWDAAWVFIKFRVNSGEWMHAQLSQTDFVAAAGSTIDVSSDGVGAFVYRDSDGSGDLNLQNMRLRWDYGSIGNNDIIDVQVFAIEMVNVPEGAFSVGSPGTEVGKFYSNLPSIPYQINSENAITVSTGTGNLYYSTATAGSRPGDQLGPIPAEFPKGFNAFYCMKYEMTQGQWVSFFNTLTALQKSSNDITGPDGKNQDTALNRNTISWEEGSASATTTSPDVPLNYVSNKLLLAYLDWAGLRPMTELEYEKACRGPVAPKANEFAWGSANIASRPYNLVNDSQPNELISNPELGTGNALYSPTNGTPSGPKRVGILAASAINKTREETGGSYYGVMELTGNMYERCISVGNPEGRTFTAIHGDGLLTNTGLPNVSSWPVTYNTGIGYRGGSFFNGSDFIRVSDRYDAASVLAGANNRLGFRGVRSAN
ncbi:SUMF1/EgtB/PvdO family nonheme iron enzyme [Gelidibacter pelagius]|uniref:SUMF1/EgtB/PvdO family nonheme iron enzyme n=1 Tax=Gelidibacter pelagius TaxID=2819985 RepID=A0ABS3SVP3_9FLAO|nr:SUMF1/EgtB/PvdO family nonheme iron enzyme [Gelidibacter pelagius]MBO3099827.1 SUMF1/EgtB/PvdO family nonheme iron enzyme [Gelidibacter pelagius]